MALQDSSIITLPGRSRIRIPIVGTKKNNDLSGISKSTPEWMISFDNLKVSSTWGIAGDAIELFGFSYNTMRETVGHSVNQLIASAATRHSDLVVLIQNSTYSPMFEQYMNNGSLINNITITRWGWVTQPQKLEERIFKMCYITQFRQILDYLVLFIRHTEKMETIFIYDQNGVQAGGVVSSVNAWDGTSAIGDASIKDGKLQLKGE